MYSKWFAYIPNVGSSFPVINFITKYKVHGTIFFVKFPLLFMVLLAFLLFNVFFGFHMRSVGSCKPTFMDVAQYCCPLTFIYHSNTSDCWKLDALVVGRWDSSYCVYSRHSRIMLYMSGELMIVNLVSSITPPT